MEEVMFDSTEMDTEFDIVDEITKSINDLERALRDTAIRGIPEKMNYIRFLLDELDDALKGDYAYLRRRRFIIKKTP
jgi:hypothetical protein